MILAMIQEILIQIKEMELIKLPEAVSISLKKK